MCNSGMEARVENYFSTLNFMTKRIIVDKATVQTAHGATWNGLSHEEKCRKLDDSFIKSHVNDKYCYYPVSKPDVESFPKLCLRGGEKYVVDEENQQGKGSGNTWRDEHSGPFTWETQSQLDLTFPASENNKRAPPLPCKPPPQDKLGASKFYKQLPAVVTTNTTAAVASAAATLRPSTPASEPTPAVSSPVLQPPQTKRTNNAFSEPQQVVTTPGAGNNKSLAPAQKETVVGKVAAAVAAANSINSSRGQHPSPSSGPREIRVTSPRGDNADGGVEPRAAAAGQKIVPHAATPKSKPPPPPIPVAKQPSTVKDAAPLPPVPDARRPTARQLPVEAGGRIHHPRSAPAGRASSSRTLPAAPRAPPPPQPGNARSVKEAGLSSSTNDLNFDLDLSPSSDSDIPKSGFDFLDNW